MRAVFFPVTAPLALAFMLAACGERSVPAEPADHAGVPSSAAERAAPAERTAEPIPPADAGVGADAPAPTNSEAPLRPSFGTCMRDAGGATVAMQGCIAEEYVHQDGRLNAAYRSLRGSLPAPEAQALLAAQRAWIKRRDTECVWDAATEGQAQRLVANDCMLQMTAVRAAELERMMPGGVASAGAAFAGPEVSADATPDGEGRLRLALSGADVAVDADGCSEHTASVQRCTGGARATVAVGGETRELRVDTLYLNSRATAYRGPLDDAADRAGRSIVLADFDRDGREDIALWTGTRGANGAASYDVYLGTADGYRRHAALSALTEGANGLFTLDEGQLVRMSKSGCCIHTTARYAWRDGQPLLVEEVVEDATANRAAPIVTTRRRIDGRMQAVAP